MARSATRVADIDTTLYIYYSSYDLGAKEIRMLFGENIANSTISKLKKRAREETARQIVETGKEILTETKDRVKTEPAFKAWGIDIDDLEKRRAKLMKLGMKA